MTAGPGSVGSRLADAVARLTSQGVPEARANAEFLMAAVLRTGRNEVRLRERQALSLEQGHRFRQLVEKRSQRVPLAYVLGCQDFMDLTLEVGPDVLIPRPETEELVMEAQRRLAALGRPRPVIWDIGTGSGCVAIALAKILPEAIVLATDFSPAALALARRNAEACGVIGRIRFSQESLFAPGSRASGRPDLMISNPPYIPSAEIDGLEPEVLEEPRLALDGGPDGLEAIRAIVSEAPRQLRPGGLLLMEIGSPQGPEVLRLLRACSQDVAILQDLQGLDRIAFARF